MAEEQPAAGLLEAGELAHGRQLRGQIRAEGRHGHLVEHRAEVDAVGGEHDRAGRQLQAQRLVTARVPRRGEAGDGPVAEDVVHPVDEEAVMTELEVCRVVHADLDEAGVMGGTPLGLLHHDPGVRHLSCTAAVVEVEVAEDDQIDIARSVAGGGQAGGELGTWREVHGRRPEQVAHAAIVVAQAGVQAGVEEHEAAGVLDQPRRDGQQAPSRPSDQRHQVGVEPADLQWDELHRARVVVGAVRTRPNDGRVPPVDGAGAKEIVDDLRRRGMTRGDRVAIAVGPGVGLGFAVPGDHAPLAVATGSPSSMIDVIASVERELRPRWVVWSSDSLRPMVEAGLRIATGWDIAAVQRMLDGGWRADPARVWARLHGLDVGAIPAAGPPDLFTHAAADAAGAGDPEDPIRADGHLRPDWVDGGWTRTPARLAMWARLAATAADHQEQALAALVDRPLALAIARSESTAELLCVELQVDGLPMDRGIAEQVIAGFIGPRPRSELGAATARAERDDMVLRHAPPGARVDLRSPADVRALLRRVGVDVPDTRAWRLEAMKDVHSLVAALLIWRRAERIATTYGYPWLDAHLGADGRLRGAWTGSDGAAGRMTASAGLHNMPADMRPAVIAEPGHVFVRADLGQIEPRVLAAVSGDRALAAATAEADMYAPVARRLGVERSVAKVAVLGAMYGQTTGHGAQALRGLDASYPVAMAYLREASVAGQERHELRTYGGRLIRFGAEAGAGADSEDRDELDDREARSRAAARGRYGRNAMVQGAAAELFKLWAVLVRARSASLDGRIVLCLHDELLVHAPVEHGAAVAALLDDCLQEAAGRWALEDRVRFVAEVSVLGRWSDVTG
jgi:DNA polymerase I